jgi:5-methylcytosine-specific restriction endonuclease McrA
MKICVRCKEEMPESIHDICKKCINRDYYITNREKIILRSAEWASNNPDRVKEITSKSKKKRRLKLTVEERKQKDKEEWSKRKSTMSFEEREKRRIRSNTYYQEHKSESRLKQSRQKSKQTRRSSESNTECTLTIKEWEEILIRYNYRCAYCKEEFPKEQLEKEHFIPVALGGGYTKDNIIPSCAPCNRKKGKKLLNEIPMPLA